MDHHATSSSRPDEDTYPYDNYPYPGEPDATLWATGFEDGETSVTAVCEEPREHGPPPAHATLGLQLSKPTDSTARGHTLLVSYRVDGSRRTRTAEVPMEIVLCEGDMSPDGPYADECDFWTVDRYRE